GGREQARQLEQAGAAKTDFAELLGQMAAQAHVQTGYVLEDQGLISALRVGLEQLQQLFAGKRVGLGSSTAAERGAPYRRALRGGRRRFLQEAQDTLVLAHGPVVQ